MTREMTEYRLGDICRLVKGSYSSTKTPPGDYPLVVTAAQRRTALTYDLHGPAVCIPLISSTGHGDAAIHRLHFQEGPFALANLLVALLPHEESPADAEYLYWYLTAKKDEVLVPLMRGTANVSLKEKDVADVVVPLPSFTEQQRIVARIKNMLGKAHTAQLLQNDVVSTTSLLIDSARKEYFDEKGCFDYVELGFYLDSIENGWSPACEPRPASIHEWGVLKTGATSYGSYRESENKALPAGLIPRPEYEVKSGDFLMSRANTPSLVGSCALVTQTRPRLMISDKIFRLIFRKDIDLNKRFIMHALKSPYLRHQIEKSASGTSPTMQNISKPSVLGLKIHKYDFQQQIIIADQLDHLQERLLSISGLQGQNQGELDALPASILNRAFAGEL